MLMVLLTLLLVGQHYKYIHLTDPAGHKVSIYTGHIVRTRDHDKGGCIIYLVSGNQHVKESCAQVEEMEEK